MTKQLKDIIGKKSSKVEKLKLGDAPGVDYAPKPEAEQNWVDNHTVEKHADVAGNEDDIYKASNIKRAELGRHGHVPKPKDLKAYTQANEETSDWSNLDELMSKLEEALSSTRTTKERVIQGSGLINNDGMSVRKIPDTVSTGGLGVGTPTTWNPTDNFSARGKPAFDSRKNYYEKKPVYREKTVTESENKKTESYMAREMLVKHKQEKEKLKIEKQVVTESCTFEDLHHTLSNKGYQKTHTIHDGNDDTHLYKKAGSLYAHEHLVVHRKGDNTSWYHGGAKVSTKEGKGNDSLISHLGKAN